MPTSRVGKTSVKNPSRGNHNGALKAGEPPFYNVSAQLDMLLDYDTGYPDLCSKRTFPGNGERPENPFGKRIKKPDVGNTGP